MARAKKNPGLLTPAEEAAYMAEGAAIGLPKPSDVAKTSEAWPVECQGKPHVACKSETCKPCPHGFKLVPPAPPKDKHECASCGAPCNGTLAVTVYGEDRPICEFCSRWPAEKVCENIVKHDNAPERIAAEKAQAQGEWPDPIKIVDPCLTSTLTAAEPGDLPVSAETPTGSPPDHQEATPAPSFVFRRKVTRTFATPLTSGELQHLAEEIRSLEEEEVAIRSDARERCKRVRGRREAALSRMIKGEETEVPGDELISWETNTLRVVRCDTGEVVADRPLTAEERQGELFAREPERLEVKLTGPIAVACPRCKRAAGAGCVDPETQEARPSGVFHDERIVAMAEGVEEIDEWTDETDNGCDDDGLSARPVESDDDEDIL